MLMSGVTANSVGEQFLKNMLQGYPSSSIFRYSLLFNKKKATLSFNYILKTAHVPYSPRPGVNVMYYRKFKHFQANSLALEIQNIIKKEKINVVWSFLDGPITISLSAKLQQHLTIPIVSHIWDTPEQLSKSLKFDPVNKKSLLNDFDKVLRNSNTCITVSDKMNSIYAEKFNIPTTKMVLSPDPEGIFPFNSTSSKEIKIVFAGSLYAYKPWNALLKAIVYNNSVKRNKKISLTCLGQLSRFAKKEDWIDFKGYLPVKEAAKVVNQSDIAYLPYWMSKSHSFFVQTAFPGKLTFYTAAGTPIMYHGPKKSSPNHFLKKNNVGLTCSSLKPTDILNTINNLMLEKFQNTYSQERDKLMNNIFHPEKSSEIFQATIKNISR